MHHVRHKANGGKTSTKDCVLLCFYHHQVVIHRWGWTLVLNPDGTTTAWNKDKTKVLHSHAPRPGRVRPGTGLVGNFVVNDVHVTAFVEGELDRRHRDRVQLRAMRTADDYRAMRDTIERLWPDTGARAGRLPEPALHLRVDDEWSFVETLRHLVFATDAWAGRTILAEPKAFLSWGSYPDAGTDADDAVPADVADVGVLGDVGADVVGVGVGALDVGEAEVGEGEADERWLGDADADWEARADAGALAGCDVPWNDDAAALAGEDALREAAEEEDAEPDTPGAPRPPAVDAAAEDVSPAGDWLGAGVLPPAKEVTAKPATPAAIMPAMIHTSTIGRHKRRCGRLLPPGGG